MDDFGPGSKVRLRDWILVGKEYDGIGFLREMYFDGEKEVRYISDQGNYRIGRFYYSPVMLQKVEESEEKKMKFKVGDKVKTVKDRDYLGARVFPIGTIGEISDINEKSNLPFTVDAYNDYWYYSEDMLEKVEFSIEDLKDGMVTEYRNGSRSVVLNQCFCGIDGYGRFGEYNYDLTCKYYQKFDIVKVFEGKRDSIKSILECPGKLIWERKEEPTTKDVSLDEINALLKEKYPDIDKFNLPIDKED